MGRRGRAPRSRGDPRDELRAAQARRARRGGALRPRHLVLRDLRRRVLPAEERGGRRGRRQRDGGGDLPLEVRHRGEDRPPPRRVPRLRDHARPRAGDREHRVPHAVCDRALRGGRARRARDRRSGARRDRRGAPRGDRVWGARRDGRGARRGGRRDVRGDRPRAELEDRDRAGADRRGRLRPHRGRVDPDEPPGRVRGGRPRRPHLPPGRDRGRHRLSGRARRGVVPARHAAVGGGTLEDARRGRADSRGDRSPRRMIWRNWAGDQRCAPASRVEPESEDELAAALAGASRVRVAGSGHSFTDIALTDGLQVSLRRMNRVLSVEGESVRVHAGIRLRELGAELARRGLAMENLGDVDAQTLAGALATGTHGTGAGYRNLSSQVEGMRLVTAAGPVDVTDGDDLRAARVSLGALGVATEITLCCRPLYTLRRTDERRPLAETLEQLQELALARERFEFFSFPYSPWALWRTTEKTDEPPDPPGRFERFVEDVVVENGAFGAFCRVGRALPALAPRVARAVGGLASGATRVDRSHRIYANPRLVRFTEMEYAIPRSHGAEAVRRVFGLIERRRLPLLFPI